MADMNPSSKPTSVTCAVCGVESPVAPSRRAAYRMLQEIRWARYYHPEIGTHYRCETCRGTTLDRILTDETKGREPVTDQRGLTGKFGVWRTDGADMPGGKHHGCDYFVLDLTHDHAAVVAVLAYADAVAETRPRLAVEIRVRYGTRGGWVEEVQAKRMGVPTPSEALQMQVTINRELQAEIDELRALRDAISGDDKLAAIEYLIGLARAAEEAFDECTTAPIWDARALCPPSVRAALRSTDEGQD